MSEFHLKYFFYMSDVSYCEDAFSVISMLPYVLLIFQANLQIFFSVEQQKRYTNINKNT